MVRDVSSVTQATSMKAGKVEPNIDTGALLAGAQFCDAYSIAVDDTALDARHAAERMLGRSPRWIEALLAVRHALVKPFGLKTSLPASTTSTWIFASWSTSQPVAKAAASPRPRSC